MLRTLSSVIGLAGLIACAPTPLPGENAANADEASGWLDASPLSLSWAWTDAWEQGACATIDVHNQGPDLVYWQLTLELDAELDSLLYSGGADILTEGDRLIAGSLYGEDLLYNEVAVIEWCAEPRAQPLSVVQLVAEEGANEQVDPEDEETVYGSLIDQNGALGLSWRGTPSTGCLDLELRNLTSYGVRGWVLTVEMNGAFDLTDSGGFWPTQRGDSTLELYPDQGSSALPPHGSASGRVCTDPFVEPISLRASY